MPPTLDANATGAALPFGPLTAALAVAALELADGRIACPARSVVSMRDGTLLLSMPAVADDLAIHKLITVAPRNAERELPVILGSLGVLDPATGEVLLVLDGPTVTGRRTAAVSMLALRLLGPAVVRSALVVGTGAQARHHVDALAALHPDAALRVRGRTAAAAEAFRDRAGVRPGTIACDEADGPSDVVFTCTTSREPVHVAPACAGTLVVAVGSFSPQAAEIAPGTVRGSRVYVDDPIGARHEAGDLIAAGVRWEDVTPLSALLQDGVGPTDRADAFLFKSVGCAAWDLAAARVALRSLSAR